MAYMHDLDEWLNGLFTDLAENAVSYEEMKHAIREKVLESYRNGQQAGGKPPAARSRKAGAKPPQRFTGTWQCSRCGAAITSLPFEPKGRSTERLLCLECWRAVSSAGE